MFAYPTLGGTMHSVLAPTGKLVNIVSCGYQRDDCIARNDSIYFMPCKFTCVPPNSMLPSNKNQLRENPADYIKIKDDLCIPQAAIEGQEIPVGKTSKSNKRTTVYRRNIFKSILRNMRQYAHKHREQIIEKLSTSKYSTQSIKHALIITNNLKEIEKQKGCRDKYKTLLENIIKDRSILTLILKDSLESGVTALQKGYGQGNKKGITCQNYEEYKKMYIEYYNKVREVIQREGGKMLNNPTEIKDNSNRHEKKVIKLIT